MLTVTTPAMKIIVAVLRQAGIRDRMKIMAGCAPVTRQYAGQIGAEGASENARAAVTLARSLVGVNCVWESAIPA